MTNDYWQYETVDYYLDQEEVIQFLYPDMINDIDKILEAVQE